MALLSGIGIAKDKNLTSVDLRKLCIPPDLNPGISIAKMFKRLKLSFSETTDTMLLPSKCVYLIQDFQQDGVNEIDGCGLASEDVFAQIAAAYKRKTEKDVSGLTGFQFRLGGFKGTILLDPALSGFTIHVRQSMWKYKTHQRCLSFSESENGWAKNFAAVSNDDMHDTLEINSWDTNPVEGHMNHRLLQVR